MKKVLIIGSVIIAIAAGIILYLRHNKLRDFEPLIKEKLNKLVMDASNGLYHLEIEKLEADVIDSKIILTNAHLRPDSNVYAQMEKMKLAPNDLFEVTISQLAIDDVAPADFIANKAINLRTLFINNPVIKVLHKKQPYNLPKDDSSKTIYQQIQKDISSIKVDTIILQNVDFVYTNKGMKNKETRLMNLKIFFLDILLDSSTQYDHQRVLFAKNCIINLKDHTINTSDSLYRFKIGELKIETRDKAMELKSLKFQPRLSIKKFQERVGRQQDRFDLTAGQMNFTNVDWWALLAQESFFANKMDIRNASLKVYRDKSQPMDLRSKVGKFPHQLLMKVPFPLKIDLAGVHNIDVSYTELNPKSGRPGTLPFNNISGTITNITNDPAAIKSNRFCKIAASATFLKQTPVKALFVFDLPNYKKGNFEITASIGPINSTELNEITMPLALVKLNSLDISSLEVSMKGDNFQGSGTVKMLYTDLKITALKATDDTLKKRGLLSFIANTFVLKKDNPLRGQPARIEHAEFKRDTLKSFFNLVWKTVYTGAGKTIGYNKKIILKSL